MAQRRTLISSGSATERIVGYSRAVRVGDLISVAGTTAMAADGPVGGADVAEQSRECLRRIESALQQAGSSLTDVVRTRIFVTDIDEWPDVGRVHCEAFAATRPACTIVQVARLFDPRLKVEIEVDAIAGD
jgi:enamine deaminase RidA (YjgF/YER057c/UK114 family)